VLIFSYRSHREKYIKANKRYAAGMINEGIILYTLTHANEVLRENDSYDTIL